MLISCLAYSLAFKMEATSSSKTSVQLQRTTLLYIPEEKPTDIRRPVPKRSRKVAGSILDEIIAFFN
jgi:hypothetical protein